MATYLTPGIYYQRVDASPPAITAIRTDVAGFVGIATRGLVDTAIPVESFRQFQAQFGTFTGVGFLAYTVRAFFENGGRRCWIVRVASGDPGGGAAPAETIVQSSSATPRNVWRIRASSPGVWGDNLTVTIQETHRAQTRTIPGPVQPNASVVASTNGFARATLVRLSQPGTPSILKVISDIDGQNQALVWLNDKPERRTVYDSPLSGFDLNRPVLIDSIEYTLLVAELGVPIALYERLSLIPENANYAPVVLAPLMIPTDDASASQWLPPVPYPIAIEDLRPDFTELANDRVLETLHVPFSPISLTDGRDGLSLLTTYDLIGEASSPLDSDELKQSKTRGLRVLEAVDEVAMVAVPDINIQPFLLPASAPITPVSPTRVCPWRFRLPLRLRRCKARNCLPSSPTATSRWSRLHYSNIARIWPTELRFSIRRSPLRATTNLDLVPSLHGAAASIQSTPLCTIRGRASSIRYSPSPRSLATFHPAAISRVNTPPAILRSVFTRLPPTLL